jgi:hemoglobin
VWLDSPADIGENDRRGEFGMPETLYHRIGGEMKLRQIIDTFIDRVFSDKMIGFFFRNADKVRIKEMEFQLTAKFLGADIEYQGRPLKEAHSKHPIMGGQFMRRLQILRETLDTHAVPEEVREAWLSHTESLRPLITQDAGSDCDPDLARKRVLG